MDKLTNTQVAHAKPKKKEYNLSDGKGLYLRVRPSGSRIWLFNYTRPFTKKRTNMGLGEYPDRTLASARKKRDEYRALLLDNIDPQDYRDDLNVAGAIAQANTLRTVATLWHEARKNQWTPAYADDVYQSLANHIFPKLGNKPIHQINLTETVAVLQPLVTDSKLEMVKRICQRLNMIMEYAMLSQFIPNSVSPLIGIGKVFAAPLRNNQLTIKPEELPELLETVKLASLQHVTRRLFEFQLHTMTRPSEAAGARWEEIDFENKLWRIPAERMKRKRAHTIPLTEQALEILEDMESRYGNLEFVFTSPHSPKKHVHSGTVNKALARIGYKNRLVSHGLRSIASTILNEKGHDADLIEVSLSHVDSTVRAAYNRADYLERRRVLMAWWSDYITAAATGEEVKGKKHLKIAV